MFRVDYWYRCKYLKDGICTKDEIEMRFELEGPESTSHYMVCDSVDRVKVEEKPSSTELEKKED